MVTKQDIIKSASGKNANGNTKTSFGIYWDEYETDKKTKINAVRDVFSDEAIMNITEQPGYVNVDITYKNPKEMKKHYKMLCDYRDAANCIDYEDKDVTVYPIISLSVLPHEYHGSYCIVVFNPMFFVLSPDIDGNVNTIKLVFEADNMEVYKNELE